MVYWSNADGRGAPWSVDCVVAGEFGERFVRICCINSGGRSWIVAGMVLASEGVGIISAESIASCSSYLTHLLMTHVGVICVSLYIRADSAVT